MEAKSLREQLNELADEKYRLFSSSLTPGADHILGVRLPVLRKIAKTLAKGDFRHYLREASDETFEEIMLQGMVIGYCKAGLEEKFKLIADFVPLINNWAVCDSFCNGLIIVKDFREEFWNFLQQYLNSEKEYEIRFGVVMLLNYYITPEYALPAFAQFNKIKHEGYYAKMAVAWAVSLYYISFPEITEAYLKNNELDDFTYNKAIQKITESLRVDPNTKNMLKSMKRK